MSIIPLTNSRLAPALPLKPLVVKIILLPPVFAITTLAEVPPDIVPSIVASFMPEKVVIAGEVVKIPVPVMLFNQFPVTVISPVCNVLALLPESVTLL